MKRITNTNLTLSIVYEGLKCFYLISMIFFSNRKEDLINQTASEIFSISFHQKKLNDRLTPKNSVSRNSNNNNEIKNLTSK